jgi:hypothetical protein
MERYWADIETARRKVITWLIGVVILFTFVECLRPPYFGAALRGEWNLWTIFTASLMSLVAVTALLCAGMAYYMKRRDIIRSNIWGVWLAIAAAFQFFVFDETLEFHEKIGKLLRNDGMFQGYSQQNIVEAGYFIFALIVTMLVWRQMRPHKQFIWYFVAGMILVGIETILGIVPQNVMLALYRVIPFHFPEIFKAAGVTSFICSFIALSFDYIWHISNWLICMSMREVSDKDVLPLK